jgi:hypothetical protein
LWQKNGNWLRAVHLPPALRYIELANVFEDSMGKRIAIVEDDPTIRANYTDALRRHGYEVSSYADR